MISAYRKLDKLGRIVIPKQLLQKDGICVGDVLEVSEDGRGAIVIIPKRTACVICGGTEQLAKVHNQYICADCLSAAKE